MDNTPLPHESGSLPQVGMPLNTYLQTLTESGLVDYESLSKILAFFEDQGGEKPTSLSLGQALMDRGLITAWQQMRLLKGFRQGFFINDYKLLEPISGNPSYASFRACDKKGQRAVMQILLPDLAAKQSYLERFVRAAKAAEALDHPNLTGVLDHGRVRKEKATDLYYMVAEEVEGKDLASVVKSKGPLPAASAGEIIRQAAKGLAYLHEKDIVHRNLKPNNLIINSGGNVKITNLGVARYLNETDEDESLTLANSERYIGTVDYMSPEQVFDCHNVTPSSDLYGLGCTMYYLLTGQPPHRRHADAADVQANSRSSDADLGIGSRRPAQDHRDLQSSHRAAAARPFPLRRGTVRNARPLADHGLRPRPLSEFPRVNIRLNPARLSRFPPRDSASASGLDFRFGSCSSPPKSWNDARLGK
ncbi:MAG: serine/threonine protein kinase [Planctomycetales bacterium]